MKKVVIMLLLVFVILNCKVPEVVVTWDEVYNPLVAEYGEPDDRFDFENGEFYKVDLYWYNSSTRIILANDPVDSIDGWRIAKRLPL